jgi:membrane associated rhomboid family serine protease
MGLYDRDYGRDERTPWDRVENPRSMVITLIVINAVVFLVNILFYKQQTDPLNGDVVRSYYINEWLAVYGSTVAKPWMWWQFLTYGFVHDTNSIFHLLFNMFGLFVFGRDVEHRMGRSEFLRFYLVAIVAGGIVGAVTNAAYGSYLGLPQAAWGATIGASGAVIATAVLFACYFPNREILLMLVFPVKAWVLAVGFVFFDLLGAIRVAMGADSSTAFTVHLAGACFAIGYYFLHWNLRWLNIGAIGELPARMRQRSRRMKLKLHDPDKKVEREAEEADRILAKIHLSGESSLTSSERKTLERYSRRQREKRDGYL